MILKDSGVKRLAVYVLHDNDGIVDTYIDAFLKGLRSEVSCLRVVINGGVSEEGEARVRAVADEVIIRPNEGYDITAYKEGLLAHGYEDLCEYDEAVICNDTLYGPIHPFSGTSISGGSPRFSARPSIPSALFPTDICRNTSRAFSRSFEKTL